MPSLLAILAILFSLIVNHTTTDAERPVGTTAAAHGSEMLLGSGPIRLANPASANSNDVIKVSCSCPTAPAGTEISLLCVWPDLTFDIYGPFPCSPVNMVCVTVPNLMGSGLTAEISAYTTLNGTPTGPSVVHTITIN